MKCLARKIINFLKNNRYQMVILLGIIFVAILLIAKIISLGKNKKTPEEVEMEESAYSYKDVMDDISYLASDKDAKIKLNDLVDPLYISNKVDYLYIRQVADVIGADKKDYYDVLYVKNEYDLVQKDVFDYIYNRFADDSPYITKATIYLDDSIPFKLREDLDVSDYKGKIVDCYIKDNMIFKIKGLSEKTITYENALILESDIEATFYCNGSYMIMKSKVEGLNDKEIYSLTVSNDGIIGKRNYDGMVKDKVLYATDSSIVTKNNGQLNVSDGFIAYDLKGKYASTESVINSFSGYKEVKLYMREGKVIAAVADDDQKEYENIRVLISNENFSEYKHKNATVKCNEEMCISVNDSEVEQVPKDVIYDIRRSEYKDGDIIKVETKSPDGKISLNSLKRSNETPSYRGTLYITAVDGGFNIVNEVGMEEYLYGVVSSEVPSTYGIESLKAMAVVARGYAYSMKKAGSYSKYNADIDDTSLCQIYNNKTETEEAIRAVKETTGVTVCVDNEVIIPYYFSTSAGVTLNNSDIWKQEDLKYIKSGLQLGSLDENVDLSDEDKFRDFIDNYSDKDYLEKELPFFRWKAHLTTEEMTRAVNKRIGSKVDRNLGSILVKEDDDFKVRSIDDLGNITDIKVTKRSKTGAILEMEITGDKNTIKVTGSINFDNLIIDDSTDIELNDGSSLNDWGSLLSSVYYVKKTEDGFDIIGGGLENGVGLSLYGATVLSDRGYSYKEILNYYYSGIIIKNSYTGEEI